MALTRTIETFDQYGFEAQMRAVAAMTTGEFLSHEPAISAVVASSTTSHRNRQNIESVTVPTEDAFLHAESKAEQDPKITLDREPTEAQFVATIIRRGDSLLESTDTAFRLMGHAQRIPEPLEVDPGTDTITDDDRQLVSDIRADFAASRELATNITKASMAMTHTRPVDYSGKNLAQDPRVVGSQTLEERLGHERNLYANSNIGDIDARLTASLTELAERSPEQLMQLAMLFDGESAARNTAARLFLRATWASKAPGLFEKYLGGIDTSSPTAANMARVPVAQQIELIRIAESEASSTALSIMLSPDATAEEKARVDDYRSAHLVHPSLPTIDELDIMTLAEHELRKAVGPAEFLAKDMSVNVQALLLGPEFRDECSALAVMPGVQKALARPTVLDKDTEPGTIITKLDRSIQYASFIAEQLVAYAPASKPH